jgi:hypothetical protein
MVTEFEHRYLERILEAHGGVVTRAAAASGSRAVTFIGCSIGADECGVWRAWGAGWRDAGARRARRYRGARVRAAGGDSGCGLRCSETCRSGTFPARWGDLSLLLPPRSRQC